MKFTIIPDDKFVSINGLGYSDLEFIIKSNVHAVQWYDNFGEIEFKSQLTENGIVKPSNEIFTNYDQFKSPLDAWQAAHDAYLAELATSEAQNGN